MKLSKQKSIMSKFLVTIGLIGITLFMSGGVVFGAEPTLTNVNTWLSGEVQIAIGLVALVLCIVLAMKQKISELIGVVLLSAFVFFMANDPKVIFNAIGGLFSKIFGG